MSLGGVGGAVAGSMITSADIKDGQVKKVDIGDDAVGGREVLNGSLSMGDLNDSTVKEIQSSHTHYAGPHWGIVDRNVIGNGDSYLRSGPYSWDGSGPPLGDGSLGIRTGSGADKANFGDELDFQGRALSTLSTVKYSVFATGEDLSQANGGQGNLPNVQFEIDPQGNSGYSTLGFLPQSADAGKWTEIDASTAPQWWLTGSAGTSTQCTQATPCTLADIQQKLPDAKIYTVLINKGRDNAFSGAVDDLVINQTAYDFEPFGVTEVPVQ